MEDDLFPSGPWTGFYNYEPANRHRMDLHLTFSQGRLQGEGVDDVGSFLIRGTYSAPERECQWTKAYLRKHEVYYRGFREGKGIWGTWEISASCHGGFHIWPVAEGAGEGESDSAEKAEPVEAIGKEEPAPSRAPCL